MTGLERDPYDQAQGAETYANSRHDLLERLVLEATRARLREYGGFEDGGMWVLVGNPHDVSTGELHPGHWHSSRFPGPPEATGVVRAHTIGDLQAHSFDLMDVSQQIYDPIRRNIESFAEPWMDLPEPAATEPLSDALSEFVTRLADPGAPGSGHHTDDLYGYYAGLLTATNDMTGLAMSTFRQNYADRLRLVTANNRNLVGALLAVSEAQRLLWMSGRAAAVKLLESYTEAFKQVPGRGGLAELFKIIGLVTTTVAAIVSTKGLALIGAGAAVGGAISEWVLEPAGDTVNSLWTELQAEAEELSTRLLAEEEFAGDVLRDMADHTRDKRDDYFLGRPTLLDETERAQFIVPGTAFEVHAEGLRVAANDRLRPAAEILDEVVSGLTAGSPSGLWSRSAVGMAPSGPTVQFNGVRARASSNLKRLATDLHDLADVLEVVADNYDRTDEEFTAALEDLARVTDPPILPPTT